MFKQEYLWKYLSLDKFVSILENNGLYFTTIKNLKHNIEPDECCILDYHLEYNNVKVSELQNNIILIKKDMSVEDNIINNDNPEYLLSYNQIKRSTGCKQDGWVLFIYNKIIKKTVMFVV